jgi:NADH-quinone oxidoreductase subunit G
MQDVDAVLTTRELGDMLKEANIDLMNLRDEELINIAVAHGLGNARKLLEDIRAGKSHYHAIEIMACPGGCIGGGQPYHFGNLEVLKKRMEGINKEDRNKKFRKSHELLHTYFVKRENM